MSKAVPKERTLVCSKVPQSDKQGVGNVSIVPSPPAKKQKARPSLGRKFNTHFQLLSI